MHIQWLQWSDLDEYTPTVVQFQGNKVLNVLEYLY